LPGVIASAILTSTFFIKWFYCSSTKLRNSALV
jgi:hypothetical protein